MLIMSCPIKTKTIKYLQDKGAIDSKRVIINATIFNKQNDILSKHAREKYSVGVPSVKLFRINLQNTKYADGSPRTIMRAVPNETYFKLLDEAITMPIEQNTPTGLFATEKPLINVTQVSDDAMLEQDNPIKYKEAHDSLIKDIDEFNDFINCIWP
jgi:hypothetical protein